jgi:hypothetical protein
MSRTLADYRSVQIDIRAIEMALGAIHDEEKSHPAKAVANLDTLEKCAQWGKIRGEMDRRRAYFRKQLAAKEEQKAALFESLLQTPLSMTSMADLVNKMTYIESCFGVGVDRAWDAVSDFIDSLEGDMERVKGLKAA